MYKHRLKKALAYYKKLLTEGNPDAETAKREMKRLATQIAFFQHERLVHLIVTVLFGLSTVITIPFNLMLLQPSLMLLSGLLIVLLVPYIGHYFHLENGVQTLYKYYDYLERIADEELTDIYEYEI
ncbi:MAG: hypothetical protein K5639_06000 [Eubacterium sp.]|nr:hypothetical protein [Eubacterium sp.]